VQGFLENKAAIANSCPTFINTSGHSLVYMQRPPHDGRKAELYIPSHMDYRRNFPVTHSGPTNTAAFGTMHHSLVSGEKMADTSDKSKNRQNERQLIPNVMAIGRILNHDLRTKRNVRLS